MTKEERLLAKLAKLYARRAYHAWRLGDVDAQIKVAIRELAKERGVVFLRSEQVQKEVAGHG